MALAYPKPVAFPPASRSLDLVVLVHGWGYPWDRLRDLRRVVLEEYPDADLLAPRYPASWGSNRWVVEGGARPRSRFLEILRRLSWPIRFIWAFFRNLTCWLSRADAARIAADLSDAIQEAVDARAQRPGDGYRKIVLIGHSVGALMIRKAYVYGRGQVQDCPTQLVRGKKPWPGLVERMVLMSSMDRGWTLTVRPEYMSRPLYWFFRLIQRPARKAGLGKLIFATLRGSPFIGNLRVQWSNLNATAEGYPLTILLVGKYDNMMKESDHQDVLLAGDKFCSLVVTSDGIERSKQTGHYDILRFTPGPGHSPESCEKRERLFRTAIADPVGEIGPQTAVENRRRDEVTRVVYLVHGIRDYGDWVDAVAEKLKDVARAEGMPEDSLVVRKGKYVYFSLLNFLIPRDRLKVTREFMDSYTQDVAQFPNARRRFGFVGHSHGTHMLAQAMRDYKACRFERVALTGSVVDRDYEWDEFEAEGRLQDLRNDVATRDWVVGLFPAFHEQLRRVFRRPRGVLGSGGLTGFTRDVANRNQFTVDGGHGAALDPRNHESLSRFILLGPKAGAASFPIELKPQKPEENLQWVTKISGLVWFGILLALLLLLAFTYYLTKFLLGWWIGVLPTAGWAALVVAGVPWVVVVLALVSIWYAADSF
ncbi:alpha/beta fold hydrolase [Paludisphaera rhizosphaerae]|uniref:alpha/beta fold hydrolase n=1 Tax=Paludisphaera rhizosphaerae TaxID=2711216 RepID=UPI0013E9A9A0|nr:alpha/beta fold hydrolase [Paludisphaera rhizosphaerae]